MKGLRRCLSVLLLLVVVTGVQAQPADPAAFRLYLVDGTEVTLHGEFARVDGQVVASVLVGSLEDTTPAFETVSIPSDRVDWPRTDAYMQAVRLERYVASTAERDYAAFTDDIAATISRVSTTPDPLERIVLVERARARLVEWPREHYGYHQESATAMLGVLDDVLAGLRAAAGQQHFSLMLASGTDDPPPAPPLRPRPTLRDLISQSLGLARHLDDPAERTQVLAHALRLLDAGGPWDRDWAKGAQRQASRMVSADRKATRAYASLRDRVITRAAGLAERGDVHGLMRLRADTLRQDERMGSQRSAVMAAVFSQLDLHLEAARRLRLALDRWEQRRPAVEAYVRGASDVVGQFGPVTRALEDIRTLAGPALVDLDRADAVLAGVQVQVGRASVPDEAADVQALLGTVLQMTANALRTRRLATLTGSLPQAWEASAAAAGALLMMDRVRADLARLPQTPRPAGSVAGAVH